jgi:hypothetical protein
MLHDSLVLLISIDLGDLAVVVHLEESIVNETGDLALKVDLGIEFPLHFEDLLFHLIILSHLGFNLDLLGLFSFLLLLNLFRSPSSLGIRLQHVVRRAFACAHRLTLLEDVIGLLIHLYIQVVLDLDLLMSLVDETIHPESEWRADSGVDDVDDVLPRHLQDLVLFGW